jgi:predicted SAM-dependent methyltransferase
MTVKYIFNRALNKLGFSLQRLSDHKSDTGDIQRLTALAKDGNEIKLHFGCGPRILKGWVNIDLSYAHYGPYLQYYTDKHYPEHIRGSREDLFIINLLKDGLPLPDNSVDLIFHEDFFEHLTQKEQFVFLAETLRVMKPGAVHRVNTPNVVASMKANSLFEQGKDGVFTSEWDTWHHFNIISPGVLKEMAEMVGYKEIVFNSKDRSIINGKLPTEYRPDEKDRPEADANVFADLIK